MTIIIMRISATIFQNITERLPKNGIFCSHYFGAVIAAQAANCHPRVRKRVIKLRHVISKHEQAFIPTAI